MGEIAEAMIDGLFCEQCGELIDGESVGYPRSCDQCSDTPRQSKECRRSNASDDYYACRALAEEHGLRLVRHSQQLYAISPASGRWLVTFYPGNGRLYADRNKPEKAPYLDLDGRPPTLRLVVEAAIRATGGREG